MIVVKMRSCLLAALCVLPAAAGAETWQWQGALGGDVRWFDWREHQNDKQLLMEFGPMGTLAGSARVRYAQVYSSLDIAAGVGAARYDGHLQDSAHTPYEADAFEHVVDAEWQVGWLLPGDIGNVHAGFMQRYWHRFINGSATVSSAEEAYDWQIALLGGEAELFPLGGWRVGAALDVGVPVNSRQKVYSDFLGDFNLEPGHGVFLRVAVPLRYQNWEVRPYYQQQDMADSNVVTLRATDNSLRNVYQPASIRRELGVALRWRFGGGATPP